MLLGWIEDRPGTRPSLWRPNDAPEERRPIPGNEHNLFKVQAAYLDCLGLLKPSERERLPVDAFDPVLILPADDPYWYENRA